jgi:hypothetical protein
MARDVFQLQGLDGGIVLSGTDVAPAGNYRWMKVISDTVLDTFVSNLTDGATKLVSVTLPAGTEIGGVITGVELTSGLVILYKMA